MEIKYDSNANFEVNVSRVEFDMNGLNPDFTNIKFCEAFTADFFSYETVRIILNKAVNRIYGSNHDAAKFNYSIAAEKNGLKYTITLLSGLEKLDNTESFLLGVNDIAKRLKEFRRPFDLGHLKTTATQSEDLSRYNIREETIKHGETLMGMIAEALKGIPTEDAATIGGLPYVKTTPDPQKLVPLSNPLPNAKGFMFKSPVKKSVEEPKMWYYFWADSLDNFIDAFKYFELPNGLKDIKIYKENWENKEFHAMAELTLEEIALFNGADDFFGIEIIAPENVEETKATFWGYKEITTFETLKEIANVQKDEVEDIER